MKKFIISLIFTLLVIPSFAQHHISVKGVELKGNIYNLIRKFERAGLKFSSALSNDSRTVLTGDFAGYDNCMFLLLESEDKSYVAKVSVIFPEEYSWNRLKVMYDKLCEQYDNKYEVISEYTGFDPPYKEGDGNELRAIDEGKCHYGKFYSIPWGLAAIQLMSTAGKSGAIYITYEDNANMEKYEKERNQKIQNEI